MSFLHSFLTLFCLYLFIFLFIGLGNKKEPFHVLVRHGEIPVKSFPPLENGWNHELLREWFLTDEQMEGVVWHCADGKMFKVL